MVRRMVLCFIILLLSLQVRALDAFVGHTLFHLPVGASQKEMRPMLEIYWEMDPATLHFANDSGTWITRIKTDVVISNENGIIKEDHFILQTPPVTDRSLLLSQNIIDIHRYMLPAGNIRVEVKLSEVSHPENVFSYSHELKIDTVSAEPFMSQLQLLDTALAVDAPGPFKKNKRQHIPLSANFMDDDRKLMHYYLELYQLDRSKFPYTAKVFISKDRNEGLVADLLRTDSINNTEEVVPVYGSIPLAALNSGNYYLNAALIDKDGTNVFYNSLFFQRVNKHPLIDTTSNTFDTTGQKKVVTLELKKTFVAKFTPAQLKAILKMILPISDPGEKQNIQGFLKRPDEMYMRYFIYNFWLNRNINKPEKEWEAYADKVLEVNKMFGSNSIRGYETDRGIIYLKYGKPNDRIVVSGEQGSLPYEIWQYNSIKGVGRDGVFLFYRPQNMANDMRLLHSTVAGEIRDMNWPAYLFPDGVPSVVETQAQQYIRNR